MAARGRRRALERAEVGVPAVGVAGAARVEAASQRARGRVERAAAPCRRSRARASRAGARRRRARCGAVCTTLPLRRRVVGPVHAEVGAQVGPAVAGAEVAARGAREAGEATSARAAFVVACDERVAGAAAACRRRRRSDSGGSAARRAASCLPVRDVEAHVDQQRVARRVGDVGLGDPVAPGARVDLAVGQRARVGQLDRVARRSRARARRTCCRRRRRTAGRAAPACRGRGSRPRSARRRRACARPCSSCAVRGAEAVLVGLGPQCASSPGAPRCGRGGRRRRARRRARNRVPGYRGYGRRRNGRALRWRSVTRARGRAARRGPACAESRRHPL